jgi:hypothetical protein
MFEFPPMPSVTATRRNDTYAAISPERPELSARGETVVITGAVSNPNHCTAADPFYSPSPALFKLTYAITYHILLPGHLSCPVTCRRCRPQANHLRRSVIEHHVQRT